MAVIQESNLDTVSELLANIFQPKIDLVDNTKTLTAEVDGTYGDFEWSYSGLHVKGGSVLAVSYGLAVLLEEMGFRFYGTPPWSHVQPGSIATGLSAAKQQYWMPNPAVYLGSGQSWTTPYAADLETLINRWTNWRYLNGVGLTAYPAGARWDNIIGNNSAWFAARPQLFKPGDPDSFDLANLSPSDYEELTEMCAAHLLNSGLNTWNRTNCDASDGDTNLSDDFYPFAKRIGEKVRAGTNPIGTIGAKAGVADAEIGVYAYSLHDLPPTNTVAPEVYTQIALNYNSTNYTLLELVQLHSPKTQAVSLREYYDDVNFGHSQPYGSKCSLSDYFDTYDAYHAANVRAVNGQFNTNWAVDLVGMRWFVKKMRDGVYTFEQALSDVVNDLFGGDPKVAELYRLWGNRFEGHHRWSLRKAFDIVNDMQPGAYKRRFQDYLVIVYEQMYLPPQIPLALQTPSDPFPAACSKLCSMIVATRMDEMIHGYALLTQDFNGDISDNYPALYYEKNPKPAWYTNTPVGPTETEFSNYRAAIQAVTTRSADFDSEDLVLLQGLTPTFNAGSNPLGNPSTFYFTHNQPVFAFIGPGTIVHEQRESNGTVIANARTLSYSYGPGLHFHYPEEAGYWRTTWTSGMLFLKAFPRVRRDNGATAFQYIYNPLRCVGLAELEAESRVRLYTAGAFGSATIRDILPSTSAATVASWIPAGQIVIEGGNTSGFWNAININPWISPYPTVALLPRVIAEEERANYLRGR